VQVAQPVEGGSLLRAIDKTTGEIIYEYALPANQSGHPITYLVGGKQYIVLGVGARGVPAELVALTVD
jgi:quinoprotein glucose dehydrogenase